MLGTAIRKLLDLLVAAFPLFPQIYVQVMHIMFHVLSLYICGNEEDPPGEGRERMILILMRDKRSLGKGHRVIVLTGSIGHALL